MYRLILIYALLLWVCFANAQHPYYHNINNDNGLPTNEVYYLLQDSFGFVWIGSAHGLYRYDGTDFLPFSYPKQTGKAISHLQMDTEGKLWCQNFSGQVFSVSGDNLRLEFDWSNEYSNYPEYSLAPNGAIWLTSNNGLQLWQKGGKVKHFVSAKLIGTNKGCLFADVLLVDEKLFFAEKTVLGYIANDSVAFITATDMPTRWPEILESPAFTHVGSKVLLLSRTGNRSTIWEISNDSVLWRFDIPEAMGRTFGLHDDGAGRLWIGSSNGALCLDYSFKPAFEGRILFPDKSVSDVILDKEGSYWFSTLQHGIFMVPSMNAWVFAAENSPLAATQLKKIVADNAGWLYLGYQNGSLSKFNVNTSEVVSVTFPNSSADVQALCLDTVSNELIVAQYRTWKVNTSTMVPQFVGKASNTKSLCRLPDGRYLIAATLGTYIARLEDEVKEHRLLRNTRANHAYYDTRNQTAWVCYIDGLWAGAVGDMKEITLNGESIFGTGIAQTEDGMVWVGTSRQGLIGLQGLKVVTVLKSEIALKDGLVKAMAAKGNVLWVVGTKALIAYNTITQKHETYTRFDGLPSMEITDIAFIGDRVYLATPKGLVSIPDTLKNDNLVSPSIFISNLAINEKDTVVAAGYTLPFARNNIHITFKGVAFRSQGQFTYRYRMLGLNDNEWISTTSSSNFARYPSLPAGKYTFEVMALNENGLASDEPARLNIIIQAPYWQTWWFYLVCGFGLVAMVSSAFLWRIRSIRVRNRLQMRMANSQLSALKSQMNPHFMFNALNSIQDLVLQQDTANAQLYLGKFSELTRRVLEASGKEFISLTEEIDILTLYLELEQLRFGIDFSYSLAVDPELETDEVRLPAMLLQPFVENALKHGLLHKRGEKQLVVTFKQDNGKLVCEVQDNGIGREASAAINARKKKPKSFSTQATAERIKLLNDYHHLGIWCHVTDLPIGTNVMLILPLKQIA